MRRRGVAFGWIVGGAILALAAVVLTAGPGRAGTLQTSDDDDREVLIGTVDVPADGGDEHTSNVQIAPNRNGLPQRGPGVAAAFFARAERALQAGDEAAAERLFERTIAADPQGPRASDARKYLGQLYSNSVSAGAKKAPQAAHDETGNAGAGVPEVAGGVQRQSPSSSEPGSVNASDSSKLNRLGAAPAVPDRGPRSGSPEEQFITDAGDRVFFSAGSAELGGRARSVLSSQAAWLAARTEWNVTIEGHADDPSLSPEQMDDLSEARARVVQERLVAEGVDAKRISIVPWGRQVPISDCPEAACQAQNRRAVTVLTPKRGPGQKDLSQYGPIRPASGRPIASSRDQPAAR